MPNESTTSDLPLMEHTFNLDVMGDKTGKHFTGEFTYHRPNIRTKIEITKSVAKVTGGLSKDMDDEDRAVAQIVCWLEHCLTAYPKWWKESDFGRNLYDFNVLSALSGEISKFEEQWQQQIGQTSKT